MSNNVFFFSKIVPFMRYVEKCFRAWQAIDENIAHVHCMMDTHDYKHTLSTRNTYCLCTAKVVAWTHRIVTLIRTLPILFIVIKLLFLFLRYIWIVPDFFFLPRRLSLIFLINYWHQVCVAFYLRDTHTASRCDSDVPHHLPYFVLDPLNPKLNPSAQRYLTRFFTGEFVSWTVNFVNICVKNQQLQQLFIQLINYVW
jgi:hypothetical protein